MKNWQQRWFVLRGDQLFYYKDKDEAKPQVSSACSMVGTDRGGAPGRVDHTQERGRQSPHATAFAHSDTPAGLPGVHPQPPLGRHGHFTGPPSAGLLPC